MSLSAGAPASTKGLGGGVLSWGTHALLFALAIVVVICITVLAALHDGTPTVLTALASALFGGGLVATPNSE